MKYLLLCILAFSFIACQEIVNEPPPSYDMLQNFPNPFADTTVIWYGIPSSSVGPQIRVVVNDRFNQTMATLVNTHNHPAGWFKVTWNGRGPNYERCPAGIYYIELQQLDSPNYDGIYIHSRKAALKQ
jgi:hypothetical protein